MNHLLIIDHKRNRAELLLDELSKVRRVSGGGQLFSKQCPPQLEILENTDSSQFPGFAKKLAITCRKENKWPSAILVDLIFPHAPSEVPGGLDLLKAVRSEFPRVPIGLYTQLAPDAVLDCAIWFSGADIFMDLANPETHGAELDFFVNRGQEEAMGKVEKMHNWVLGAPSSWNVEWDPGTRLGSVCKNAIEALAWEIFRNQQDVDHVHAALLNPGFSGTYLVRIITYNEKNNPLQNEWVLKAAEHQEEIQKLTDEINGFSIMQQRLDNAFRPELHQSTVPGPKRLLRNWWAAIALSFERGYSPLLEQFNSVDSAGLYKRLFREVLSGVFGEIETDHVSFDVLSERTLEAASLQLEGMARWLGGVSMHHSQIHDDVTHIRRACKSEDLAKLRGMSNDGCGCGFKYIHGDLNCRNIMVDDNATKFKLIDFPHVSQEDSRPCATDFAKAEAELLFIVMDYHTGRDIDPSRIPRWVSLLEHLCRSLDSSEVDGRQTRGFSSIVECISEIRRCYQAVPGDAKEAWIQYRLVLLDNCLRYVSYTDLTPAKRCLAVIFARMLLDSLG